MKVLGWIAVAVLGFLAFRQLLAYLAIQAELDRAATLAVAKQQTTTAKWQMVGGIAAGVGGIIGGLTRVFR